MITLNDTVYLGKATAVQPTIPTVNNATITLTQGGTTKGSFTLNQASDATIALDAGGSGSAPSLTWFTGNTGSSFDTGISLDNANLVKVYKNGVLLQQHSTRTIYSYTGVSGSYLILNNRPPLDTANTWSIDLHFSNWVPQIYAWPFGNSVTTDCTTPGLGFEWGNPNSLFLFLTSQAGSWNIADTSNQPSSTPAPGDVKIKVSFDGVSYKLQYKDSNSPDNWVTSQNIATSAKTYFAQDATLKFLNRGNNSYSCTGSTLVLNDLVITIDGQEWFNGETDRADITNYGCTETTEVINGDNDYNISGSTLVFATVLEDTDKIAVEVF